MSASLCGISRVEAAREQSDDVHSDGSGEIALRQCGRTARLQFWEPNVGIGPIRTATLHRDITMTTSSSPRERPPLPRYIASEGGEQGQEKNEKISEVRRWNSKSIPISRSCAVPAAARRACRSR